MQVDYLDLYELQEELREGLEELFPLSVWIKAEIASVQVRTNGHCYMELCSQVEGRVVARAKAVIWRSRFQPLIVYFREATGDTLRPGMEILCRAQVNYSEIYGLSLVIDEIEPAYTLGAAELQRRQTIERLAEEGLLEKQKTLTPAVLPYRLAVISAPDAAGYGDFCRHLTENEYGFVFDVELFPASMQGESAAESIADALTLIESSQTPYDAALIMRGGGSSLDLACFDDYGLCFSIAQCPIPVYTAIGHERDKHVADMVAYTFVKTPTALADLFIDAICAEDERISSIGNTLRMSFLTRLNAIEARIDVLESRIRAANPRRLLERGYSLITDASGVILKSSRGLNHGDILRVLFADGQIEVTVNTKS